MNKTRNILIFLMLIQFSSISHAQFFSGPLAQALGGAGRGAADEGEQALINPAALVHSSNFTSAIIYADGYWAKNEHDRVAGFVLSDNSEDIIAAGAYAFFDRRATFENFNTIEQQYHQFSVAKFLYKHISLGLTALYLKTELIGGEIFDQWDGHLALHYNPKPDFGFGLVYYNIAPRDLDVPSQIQNKDKIALGVHYIAMPMFRMRLDLAKQLVQNPDEKNDIYVGIESKMSEFFFARFGWTDEGINNRNYYSLGLGFDGPRMKIDYFFRKNVDYNGGAMHGVDLRLPFW